ncbi:Retrovirus-related Pol polyprotein from transposon TNT 1-94 [Vitis vinifera]|uniref:Retrovirus-related Pol polyprotein from transposon TNT 1-94 n=1 Tax=Vitis vinifera TaxID=29760 RepID=A0A438H6C3_VITVI|nr:Retrovirus-related Pol polyprotein from transposon TNT 1-94 [Vitis vinifera]
MTHLDPRTNQCELEVQRIIHLQNLANQLPDAFIDTKKVTKSHIPAANTPARIDVPVGQLTNESKIRLKRVASDIIRNDEDPNHEMWKNVDIEMIGQNGKKLYRELNSLTKREVFGPVVQTPEDVKPVGYKWVFVRKRNENNEIIRYKARLVAQVSEGLDMRLMDVITAYLYGSMDNDIYMKIPEGFKLPETNNTKPRSMYSIKLQRSLYGLKQSGRMWYNRLSEYLLKEGYVNNPICPCIFIKKSETGFAIIAVYVDDLNLVGTPEELTRTTNYLKKEFEMKDLGKTKFCLGLRSSIFQMEF